MKTLLTKEQALALAQNWDDLQLEAACEEEDEYYRRAELLRREATDARNTLTLAGYSLDGLLALIEASRTPNRPTQGAV